MKHIYHLMYALMCLSLFSCSKPKVEESTYPLVKAVVFGDGYVENFEYDKAGNITRLWNEEGSLTIEYNLDANRNGTINTSGWGKFTLSNGCCTSFSLGNFSYDNGHLAQWYDSDWIQDYSWSNGCLTKIATTYSAFGTVKTVTDEIEYYEEKDPFAEQAFDLNYTLLSDCFTGQMPYIYGWFGKGSERLIKSINNASVEYDWEDNVITKVTITQGSDKYTVSLKY